MRDGEVVGIVITPELKARIVACLECNDGTNTVHGAWYAGNPDDIAEINSILKELK